MRSVALSVLLLTTAGALGAQEGTSDSVRERVLEARNLAGRGEHRQAAAILEHILMVAPNSEEALRDYSHNSLAIKDPVGAMGALEPLTRMHPSNAEYPYLMGVAQLQVAGVGLAVESLELSLRLDPNRALTMIALGFAYNAQKKYDLAKEVIARSLVLEPEEVEALAAMAEAEEGLGEIERAESHAGRALAQAPSHHAALYILGKVRMSQGRFDEARDLFIRAVATSTDSPKAHYQLSLAYARLGDLENSKKHRELYRQAKDAEDKRIIDMRTRAGMGVGGMKL
jgi:tetratricopeptide (TPR) repeat protein